MTITIGWNEGTQHYLIELYVNGTEKVNVNTKGVMQIIYLIRMMKEVYPVSIGWHYSIKEPMKQELVELIRKHMAV